MNRVTFFVALTVIGFFVFSMGCDSSRQNSSNRKGGNDNGEDTNNDSHRLPTVSTDKKTDSSEQLIYFGKGYGAIHFGMTHDQLIASAGEPERRQGTACEYLGKGFAVLFNRQKKVAAIMCGGFCASDLPMIERFKGITPEGIHMGSSLKEVLRLYGKPTEKNTFPEDPSLITLKYSQLGVEFAFRDEKLVHITMRMLK